MIRRMNKKCFKCGESKPLSEFYRHPCMGDGYLGKCKSCTKKDVDERRKRLEATDPEWAEKELARHRLKTRKYVAAGRARTVPPKKRKAAIDKYHSKHPNRKKATTAVSNAIRDGRLQRLPCSVCGSASSEAHHDDYDKPLDVIFLCTKHHAERHVLLRQQQRLLKFAK